MATQRGKDGGKPAATTEGVAPVPPQGQETTAQEAAVAGEKLPELTRAAYEAIVIANSDLSAKLADALGAVNELNGTVADLTAKLDAALTRAAQAEGRERQALAVIDQLTRMGNELADTVEAQDAQLKRAVDADPKPTALDKDAERLRVAAAFGLRPTDILSWRIGATEMVAVTIAGQKIRKAL